MLERLLRAGMTVLLALATAFAALASAAPAVRAADSTSDIPGVPLPGTVSTGQLGGPIYDVVYRLSVPPASVIVASLSGTAGTDFDLYLFDASATTVVSKVGLLTKSIGPTSSEAISWPTRTGGTFYIDLNGATNVQGTYTLTVQIVPDQTPPSLSIRLAGGRPEINSAAIPVELFATDDLSGVAEMAFSQDGTTWGAWQPFGPTTTWQAPPGDGDKTLWARVRNGVGLVSSAAQASVTLDTVPPSIVSVFPTANAVVAGLRPTFTVQFSEPVDPATWARFGVIVQSRAGMLVLGTYTYDAVTRTGRFVPSSDLEAGAGYIVTVGPVTDVAGNQVATLGSWVITPLRPTAVALDAVPAVVESGAAVALTGRLTGLPDGAAVTLLARPSTDVTFTEVATLAPSGGVATATVRPAVTTEYRLAYAGTGAIAPAQATVRVLVRRGVALAGIVPGVVHAGSVGRSVGLTATLTPPAPDVVVSYLVYRYDVVRRAYRLLASVPRTSVGGRAIWSWRPASAGRYYVRVTTPSTVLFANGVSPVSYWLIR